MKIASSALSTRQRGANWKKKSGAHFGKGESELPPEIDHNGYRTSKNSSFNFKTPGE